MISCLTAKEIMSAMVSPSDLITILAIFMLSIKTTPSDGYQSNAALARQDASDCTLLRLIIVHVFFERVYTVTLER
jgi:hypothetical protein